jgi:hypothetical protein
MAGAGAKYRVPWKKNSNNHLNLSFDRLKILRYIKYPDMTLSSQLSIKERNFRAPDI